MGRFARIEWGQVVELVEADADFAKFKERYHPSLMWVEADASVKEGFAYQNGMFTNGDDDA